MDTNSVVDSGTKKVRVRGLYIIAGVAAVLAATLSWLALYIEDEAIWVQSQGIVTADRKSDIRDALRNLHHGGVVPLTKLRTASGTEMSLIAMEGTFRKQSIDSPQNWASRHWRSAALVNSVDENERLSEGISGVVIRGCLNLTDSNLIALRTTADVALAPGDVKERGCVADAPYLKDYGIATIEDVAVVTWEKVADSEPCMELYGQRKEEKAIPCVKDSVVRGLNAVFETLSERAPTNRPDALILPGLGTGIGGLPKSVFYDVVTEKVRAQLNDKKAYLPQTFVLAVYQDDGAKVSLSTALGIGQTVVDLESYWRARHPAADSMPIWTIAGSCLGVAIAALLALRSSTGGLAARTTQSDQANYALGWGLTAIGLASAFGKTVEPFAVPMPSLSAGPIGLLYGLLAVVIGGMVMAANDFYKKSARTSDTPP